MAEPRLSIRSAKARALARELFRREGRPVHLIVEEALVQYANLRGRESAGQFLQRLAALSVGDADLTAVLDENRIPHEGLSL